MAKDDGKNQNEPFMSSEDRPEVNLPKPETPISELRVRDLSALISDAILKKSIVKELKDHKYEKFEKHEKFEKPEFKEYKDHKHEKFEKPEVKEWKDAYEPKRVFEPGPDPKLGREPGPDWGRLEDLINPVIKELSDLRSELERVSERLNKLENR